MANVTYCVVLPSVRDVDGALVAEEAKETSNNHAAMGRARLMIGAKAGVIAFSRSGDPSMGDFEDADILGRCGDVPGDFDAFTGAGQ